MTTSSPALAPLRVRPDEAPLVPVARPQHDRVLGALSRVRHVSVDSVREDGHLMFRILINGAVAVGQREIKHRYYEFPNLRRDLYYHAQSGHREDEHRCAFCEHVTRELSQVPDPPRLLKRVFEKPDKLCQELETFLWRGTRATTT